MSGSSSPSPPSPAPAGLLLAAGRGARFGRAKALVTFHGEPLVTRAARFLLDSGCSPVLVVLGAEAARAAPLVPTGASMVFTHDWAEGLGASLRTGLAAVRESSATGVLIHLVDTPGIGSDVLARVGALCAPSAVARATYNGRPGHPVLLGRDHWDTVTASARGDRGAGPWLRSRSDVQMIACDDLACGDDADTPEALRRLEGLT